MDMRLKGGAMDTIYIGVDFHARQQTVCYLKTETGELVTCAPGQTSGPGFLRPVSRASNRRPGSKWLQSLVRTNARGSGLRSLAGSCHRDPPPGSLAAEERSARRRTHFGSDAPR